MAINLQLQITLNKTWLAHTDFRNSHTHTDTLKICQHTPVVCVCVCVADWQSICTLTTITDFRHFKGFYKLPFAHPVKPRSPLPSPRLPCPVQRLCPFRSAPMAADAPAAAAAAPTLAICFGLLLCQFSHMCFSSRCLCPALHPSAFCGFIFCCWLRLPSTTLIKSTCGCSLPTRKLAANVAAW